MVSSAGRKLLELKKAAFLTRKEEVVETKITEPKRQ